MHTVLLYLAGLASVIAGAVFLPLPTPFGLPLLVLGAALILTASPTARHWFKSWRQSHNGISNSLLIVESLLPNALRKPLAATHPDAVEKNGGLKPDGKDGGPTEG